MKKTARQHYDIIRAAQAAVIQAEQTLRAAEQDAVNDLSPYMVGDIAAGKLESSGKECGFKVEDRDVWVGDGYMTVYLRGGKINRNSTVSRIAASRSIKFHIDPTLANIDAGGYSVEIENANHAHILPLIERIKFLISVAQANRVTGSYRLNELMFQGLQDWNDADDQGSYGLYIHKGGSHVAVCALKNTDSRLVLIKAGA